MALKPRLDELRCAHTVDHEGYVVAYQDSRDEELRVGVEHVEGFTLDAALLHVELDAHAVAGNERDLDAGEERRERQGYKGYDKPYGVECNVHRFSCLLLYGCFAAGLRGVGAPLRCLA